MLQLTNFFDGSFHQPNEGKYIDSFNPTTGEIYCTVPDSDTTDVNDAVNSAKKALTSWSKTKRQQRHDIMMKIADLIDRNSEKLAQAESKDQGKTVFLASQMDIPRAAYNFRYFARKILYLDDRKTDLDGVGINYVHRKPLGVVGLISPWNLPLYLLTWKIAPCIAGNTCVCKPSEMTSVTAWMLCSIFNEAGLPPGVVNMIFGNGPRAGNSIVTHPDIPAISFTGGTSTGELITKNSAPFCKKLSLELGGKNPNIVFSDADFEKCLKTSVKSSFANQGEICLCGSRIFVEASIYPLFLTRFVEEVKNSVIVGDPTDLSTIMGPVISKEHKEKVMGYIRLAKEEGGVILYGGDDDEKLLRSSDPKTFEVSSLKYVKNEHRNGYFVPPTIIATKPVVRNSFNEFVMDEKHIGMDPLKSRVMNEEIFGPVVTVTPFETEDQVLNWANAVRYGLSASIWTENGRRQRRVAEALHVGTVWVNCWLERDLNMPFGGTKFSGLGREGGDYSMEFFTEASTICLAD